MTIAHDIPLDKAELLSVLLESILYGFSLLMFGGTFWVLYSRLSTRGVSRKMFAVAWLLLALSTAHLVIHITRVMEGLILYRDTYQGGPAAYFSDVSQWTFVSKNLLYVAQTLIGDAVVLYRCYLVWKSKLIMILPIVLWVSAGVTGIGATYTSQHATQDVVFLGSLSKWITSFWASALATNLLATFLLVVRIWHVDRKATKLRGRRNSQLRKILHILIDAGVIYSLMLLVALTCFVFQSNGQYVVLDMITPIISIAFYMVIIRVAVACRVNLPSSIPIPTGDKSTGENLSASGAESVRHRPRRARTHGHEVQVRVTTLIESTVEGELSLSPVSMTLSAPVRVVEGKDSHRLCEMKYDDIGQAV